MKHRNKKIYTLPNVGLKKKLENDCHKELSINVVDFKNSGKHNKIKLKSSTSYKRGKSTITTLSIEGSVDGSTANSSLNSLFGA